MNNSKYSKIISILSSSITLGIIVWFVIRSIREKEVGSAFSEIRPLWFIGAVACILVYLICDALFFHILTQKFNKDTKLRQSIYVTFIGRFYLNVTPVGVPIQIKMISDNGVSPATATSIYTLKSKVNQATVMIYAILGLFYHLFSLGNDEFFWLAVVIISLNGMFVTLYSLFSYMPDRFIWLGRRILCLLQKMKFIKNRDKMCDDLENYMIVFFERLNLLKNEKQVNVMAYILNFIEIGAMLLITFFIYKAFGNTEKNMFEIMLVQALATAMAAIVFLPGNAGGAEGGFYIFSAPFFAQEQVAPALVLWRFATYFLVVIIGAIAILEKRIYIRRKKLKATE